MMRNLLNEINRMRELAGILQEEFKSVSDKGFKELERKYITSEDVKLRYDRLDDSDKIRVMNTVQSIANGSIPNIRFKAFSINSWEMIMADIVAAMAVMSKVGSQVENAYNFLVRYYNPYPDFSGDLKSGNTLPVIKTVLASLGSRYEHFDKDEIIDALSLGFFSAIEYLIKRRAYDPHKRPFSTILVKLTWPQRVASELMKIGKERGRRPQASSELPDMADDFSFDDMIDPESTSSAKKLTNDQKIDWIASALSRTTERGKGSVLKPVLYAWYEWFKANTSNRRGKGQNPVDYFTDINPTDESMIQHMIKYSLPGMSHKNVSSYLTRIRDRILELSRDGVFLNKMGIAISKFKDTSGMMRGTTMKSLVREVRMVVRIALIEMEMKRIGLL